MFTNASPTTYHFPLLPIELQHRGQSAGRGRRGGGFGGRGAEGFGSGTNWSPLAPQAWVLVGLLVIAHMLQAWKRRNYIVSLLPRELRQEWAFKITVLFDYNQELFNNSDS